MNRNKPQEQNPCEKCRFYNRCLCRSREMLCSCYEKHSKKKTAENCNSQTVKENIT